MNYTVKDSVFSFIFRQPENICRLYLTLHSEDEISVRWSSHWRNLQRIKRPLLKSWWSSLNCCRRPQRKKWRNTGNRKISKTGPYPQMCRVWPCFLPNLCPLKNLFWHFSSLLLLFGKMPACAQFGLKHRVVSCSLGCFPATQSSAGQVSFLGLS